MFLNLHFALKFTVPQVVHRGDFVFLVGLVGAETCCQTVQKVGEVSLEIIWPEIVEAVGRGQVTVRRKRRFQGVSEPSFRLEIHGSAGCSLSDSPAETSISRCF